MALLTSDGVPAQDANGQMSTLSLTMTFKPDANLAGTRRRAKDKNTFKKVVGGVVGTADKVGGGAVGIVGGAAGLVGGAGKAAGKMLHIHRSKKKAREDGGESDTQSSNNALSDSEPADTVLMPS